MPFMVRIGLLIWLMIWAAIASPATANPAQLAEQRVQNIGYQLVSENASFCNDLVARGGFTIAEHGQDWRISDDPNVLDLATLPLVRTVSLGGPAESAGLVPGDRIQAVNGLPVSALSYFDDIADGKRRPKDPTGVVNGELDHKLAAGPMRLIIWRDGGEIELLIEPVQTCPSWFKFTDSDKRIANADGNWVTISSFFADYAENDDELAAVIAHETAHNILKHSKFLNAQKVNRGFFGQFGKSAGRIKATEIEADRLSVWLMANAGYDPNAAIRFWSRFGKKYGKGIFSASTHYRWKKRVALLEEEIAKMQAMNAVDGKYAPPLLTKAQ